MVNKKGFVRTLEAIIAMVLLFGFIIYATSTSEKLETGMPEKVKSSQDYILNELIFNENYVDCIFNPGPELTGKCSEILQRAECITGIEKDDIMALLNGNKPLGYEINCEICNNPLCPGPGIVTDSNADVYTGSISKNQGIEKRIVRLYIWKVK